MHITKWFIYIYCCVFSVLDRKLLWISTSISASLMGDMFPPNTPQSSKIPIYWNEQKLNFIVKVYLNCVSSISLESKTLKSLDHLMKRYITNMGK